MDQRAYTAGRRGALVQAIPPRRSRLGCAAHPGTVPVPLPTTPAHGVSFNPMALLQPTIDAHTCSRDGYGLTSRPRRTRRGKGFSRSTVSNSRRSRLGCDANTGVPLPAAHDYRAMHNRTALPLRPKDAHICSRDGYGLTSRPRRTRRGKGFNCPTLLTHASRR